VSRGGAEGGEGSGDTRAAAGGERRRMVVCGAVPAIEVRAPAAPGPKAFSFMVHIYMLQYASVCPALSASTQQSFRPLKSTVKSTW